MSTTDFVIDVNNLNKSFYGRKVVSNVSLQVKRGEIFGFLGPNGSGKTTTIRMLCGLLTPDTAAGKCLGFDILTQTDLIKTHVGYMTQRFSLYEDLTIRENLDFVARLYQISERPQKVTAALERLGLAGRAKQLAGELSGGWKQRLALAAALLHEPQLLLLDEPTAGVDPNARRQFWDHIHELSQEGITTLVSTHYMDEAERCHRIAYLAYGNLLTQGTIDEVIKQAQLHTWQVSGENLGQLMHQIRQQFPQLLCVAFGAVLHVSSINETELAKIREKFSHYRWQAVTRNLEDVFIHLVEHAEDNFA